MSWRAPLPDEHPHHQAILLAMLRWCLVATPPSAVLYAVAYAYQPRPSILALLSGIAAMFAAALWGLPRVRRGELRAAKRVILMLALVLANLFALNLDERFSSSVMLIFPCIVLLATALEPPPAALAWSGATLASLVANRLLWVLAPSVPRLQMAAWLGWCFDLITVLVFLLVSLLSQYTTRFLRRALAESEEDRRALERSHAQLERQRAELQAAEQHLSDLAASLDQSHRELQRFADAVSHDLLTPVRALERDSQALQQAYAAQLDEDGRGHLEGIVESTRHMDALVTGLLAYSSLGLSRAELEAVDLGALIERVATALHLRSRAVFTVPAGAPVIQANRLRLEQVFSNLLENAIKFQRPGVRPAVAIEWADRGDAWELAVRDNGIGIEPRHFEKIFGIFQRLHLPGEYEGTGIGLAIVQKAVEEHGGKIWVASTPGEGSVFRFTLPKPGAAQPAAPATPAEGPPLPVPEAKEPERGLGELKLEAEGQRLAHGVMSTATVGTLAISPIFIIVYGLEFARRPSWASFVPLIGVLVMGILAAWGVFRLRRGDVILPARALMVVMAAAVVEHLLHREDVVLPSGAIGFALILVFSTTLERPSRVRRWQWGVSLTYLATMAVRSTWPMRPLGMGPLAVEVIRFNPALQLVALIAFSQSSIRSLRQALVRSRAARSDLEPANAALERHKAELLRAQAHLSALTAHLSRSNRDLQSFSYVASHDLRAPLRALTHYSRFLQEDCAQQLEETGRTYLQRIADGARHLDALVADLLEYSRIGRLRLEPEWVDTGELVGHVLGVLRLRAQADVTVAKDLPVVWGLRLRLEQVFSKLLGNAATHGREGTRPAIAVEWRDLPHAWELAVRDSGTGIDEKDREAIFDLCQRQRPRGWSAGTGMGLPIAKKAVEEHGGKLWVDSSPGPGSVFRFTLPKPSEAARRLRQEAVP